jgi:hypothetical protein
VAKELRKKPNGDFVKLKITHKGWNVAEIRKIIRDPEVCKLHPEPTSAERIWVCERNVPPVGSWLLNYTALEDENLTHENRSSLEEWERQESQRTPEDQKWEEDCPCFKAVVNLDKQDVWKGHVCTSEISRFNSPLVRALLVKGHAFKLERSAESLMTELYAGLEGYIMYKTRYDGTSQDYQQWKQAIIFGCQVGHVPTRPVA